MNSAILALNAGSSSFKFAVFEIHRGDAVHAAVRGKLDSDDDDAHLTARNSNGDSIADEHWTAPDTASRIERLIDWCEEQLGNDGHLIAVGHRVVHGGADHDVPERVTPSLLDALDGLVPLAPLHQPHSIAPMRAIAERRTKLAQIACFDTAFHRSIPAVASRYALPREYEASGIRRYGFHGLSYEYVARKLTEIDPSVAAGRVIVAHLGNGSSLCAMQAGRSVDTTMGFTPLDGLVMGTRCGSIDPGLILYLQQARGMSAKAIEELLYKKSGLLGVSGGIDSDMRALMESDSPFAEEAIDLFVYRIARELGGLVSSLRGLDGLVFTGGIGEKSPIIRNRVCQRLDWLGIELDDAANKKDSETISLSDSPVVVHVIPTDEESVIANHASILLRTD